MMISGVLPRHGTRLSAAKCIWKPWLNRIANARLKSSDFEVAFGPPDQSPDIQPKSFPVLFIRIPGFMVNWRGQAYSRKTFPNFPELPEAGSSRRGGRVEKEGL